MNDGARSEELVGMEGIGACLWIGGGPLCLLGPNNENAFRYRLDGQEKKEHGNMELPKGFPERSLHGQT